MSSRTGTLVSMAAALFVAGAIVAALVATRPDADVQSGGVEGAGAADGVPLTDHTLYADFQVPAFSLVDQSGATRTRADVIGDGERYTVLEFFFSNCTLICPLMNANLVMAQDQLEGYDVEFVSLSVDPANDTPATLTAHAEQLGADTSRWTFLTGEEGGGAAIVEALGFASVGPDPDNLITLPNGEQMTNIRHPSRLLVLDPEGRIVGSYIGTERDEVQEMIRDLKIVLARGPYSD